MSDFISIDKYHAVNITTFLLHTINLNNKAFCTHPGCRNFLTCRQFLSANQMEALGVHIERRILDLYNRRDARSSGHWNILALYQRGARIFFQEPAEMTGIEADKILNKLPELIYFTIERQRVFAGYTCDKEQMTVISDLLRIIQWCPTPDFDTASNEAISSVSDVFEYQILNRRCPELLRSYLAFPNTTVTAKFLAQLAMINFEGPPLQDPQVIDVMGVMNQMANHHADHPEDNPIIFHEEPNHQAQAPAPQEDIVEELVLVEHDIEFENI